MKKILLIAATAFAAVTAFAQPKFAHVNSTELVQLCPEMDKARETMTAASNEAQETFNDMQTEFNTKYQAYQSKGSTWTAAVRESKEKEINDVQQRIMEFEQSIQQELAAKQNELMAPLIQKAQEAVNQLAKAGGYIYVFETSQMLYIDPAQSTDLTPAARKALNIPDGRTLESLQAELQAAATAAQGQ